MYSQELKAKLIEDGIIKPNLKYLPQTIANSQEFYNKRELTIDEIIDIYNKRCFPGLALPSDKRRIKGMLNTDVIFFADYRFKGDTLKRKGYQPFTFTFEVRGKLVVENDLRGLFTMEEYDINSTRGKIKTMAHYAKQGLMHGFVGNSCPSVWLDEDNNEIHIGSDINKQFDIAEAKVKGYKELTSICTDLWWYSIVDLKLLKRLHPDLNESLYNIVEVPQGTYQLSHSYGISNTTYHKDLPYATLKLIK